jgi:hypothetical protein
LAFEDSNNGLQAAMGAGLATIITPTSFTADQDFKGAAKLRQEEVVRESHPLEEDRAVLRGEVVRVPSLAGGEAGRAPLDFQRPGRSRHEAGGAVPAPQDAPGAREGEDGGLTHGGGPPSSRRHQAAADSGRSARRSRSASIWIRS